MMAKVKLYRDIEGEAGVGDTVDVDADRAEFLVVNGYATYVNKRDARHLPPVGGQRPKGATIGVEPKRVGEEIQTLEEEKADAPAAEGEVNAPAEGGDDKTQEEGARTRL